MATELNPLDFQTASAYLEYILQSEGEILWMHFDEAQRIESEAKDEAYNKGWDDCKTEINNKATEFINSVKKENNEQ